MRKRRRRLGEYVCRCAAYSFPHRFSGGRCSGAWIAEETWDANWGCGICRDCHALNLTKDSPVCEVRVGQENITWCAAWREFVATHEIRVNLKLRGMMM